MKKKWNFLCDNLKREDISKVSRLTGVSQILAVAMLNRGITPETCIDYLSADESLLHDPFLMKDMRKAAYKINEVISSNGKITVYGDYDIDGVSSVSMLIRYLKSRECRCEAYIPDRETEGYGLNCDAIKKIKDSGTSLIITVDNGIAAINEAEYAASLGIDMIITDHHACGDTIPKATAVINPKRHDCPYPFKELAGAGVCFKLICAMENGQSAVLEKYGEFAALATIADVVPLTGENRVIAKIGINKMRSVPIGWLDALLDVAQIEKMDLNSYNIGFMVAPRINAAGRIGSAYDALSLMMSETYEEAVPLAQNLNDENVRRREIGNNIYSEAVEITENGEYGGKKVLVLAKENWHPGIIGISASRMADTYHKIVFLLSLSDGVAKGSGRGIHGFNLYKALQSLSPLLSKFGGHELAAGVSLAAENLDEFDRKINEYADKTMSEEDMISYIDIDCRLSCNGSLLGLCDELLKLEPFGTENQKPVFAVMGAKISSCRTSRDGKHLLLSFIKNGGEFSAIGFSMGDMARKIAAADTVNIAARLEKNDYLGRVTPQFHVLDIITEN